MSRARAHTHTYTRTHERTDPRLRPGASAGGRCRRLPRAAHVPGHWGPRPHARPPPVGHGASRPTCVAPARASAGGSGARAHFCLGPPSCPHPCLPTSLSSCLLPCLLPFPCLTQPPSLFLSLSLPSSPSSSPFPARSPPLPASARFPTLVRSLHTPPTHPLPLLSLCISYEKKPHTRRQRPADECTRVTAPASRITSLPVTRRDHGPRTRVTSPTPPRKNMKIMVLTPCGHGDNN